MFWWWSAEPWVAVEWSCQSCGASYRATCFVFFPSLWPSTFSSSSSPSRSSSHEPGNFHHLQSWSFSFLHRFADITSTPPPHHPSLLSLHYVIMIIARRSLRKLNCLFCSASFLAGGGGSKRNFQPPPHSSSSPLSPSVSKFSAGVEVCRWRFDDWSRIFNCSMCSALVFPPNLYSNSYKLGCST